MGGGRGERELVLELEEGILMVRSLPIKPTVIPLGRAPLAMNVSLVCRNTTCCYSSSSQQQIHSKPSMTQRVLLVIK
jgi:hypothetical protein